MRVWMTTLVGWGLSLLSGVVLAQTPGQAAAMPVTAQQPCLTIQCQTVRMAPETIPAPVQTVKSPVMTDGFESPENACVVVTGTATTENVDEAFARQMAIRNGLDFATLNNNVTISSEHEVENYHLTRNHTRFSSKSKIESYRILSEGLEEAFDQFGEKKTRALNYQVKMEVCLTEQPSACENLSGIQYQPRLVIAPLAVAKANEVRDISNLIPGFQTELQRRLAGQQYRNLTMLNQRVSIDESAGLFPNTDLSVLEPIRDRTGAQYMLMSVLRSASAHIEDDGYLNSAKRFYNLSVENDARYVELDWYLVDLMQGEVVHQQRQGMDVKGDVRVGRDRPFGSNAFFATDVGMVFHTLLTQQVNQVVDALQCKPLLTQVIDVRGEEVVLYLNSASGVKVGDELAVYQTINRPVQFQGVALGIDETPQAFIKIKRMMPRFAVAELVAKKGVVQVGDRVKSW